jgi:hypothetical protein
MAAKKVPTSGKVSLLWRGRSQQYALTLRDEKNMRAREVVALLRRGEPFIMDAAEFDEVNSKTSGLLTKMLEARELEVTQVV